MKTLENTITSIEAAEMIDKDHAMLLRDLRRYIKQFNDCNLALVDYFQESTYQDSKGETRPCYQITKKGCEFIAHKLTGTKGTEFTYKFIERFHEMEETIQGLPAIQSENTELLAKAILEAQKIINEKNTAISRLQQENILIGKGSALKNYRESVIGMINLLPDEECEGFFYFLVGAESARREKSVES